MENVRVFGGSFTVLSTSYNPVSSLWKMCQQSMFEDCQQSLDRLPKSGMTVNGRLYQLHNAEHPTLDVDGLALPTPLAAQLHKCLRPRAPAEHPVTGTRGADLTVVIYEQLQKQGTLPTPTVNEAKNNPSGASQWNRHDSLNVEAAKLQGLDQTTGKDFQLNPQFVEEMMGLPIGWTDLEHSETQSCHSAQNGSDNK
jgi:hypothetical protein